jgi:CubicO group peptidase (beta-lactamase class C family)
MHGASLTKLAFAYMVMQLVDEGRIELDRIDRDLPAQTVARLPVLRNLKSDARWRKLTPRILLSHSGGFANFAFLEPEEKMRLHFEPGARYAYSGEGIILLQFVLETGLGPNVGDEMQRRVFDRFARSSRGGTTTPRRIRRCASRTGAAASCSSRTTSGPRVCFSLSRKRRWAGRGCRGRGKVTSFTSAPR